jgi:hypothetical protein
MAPTVREIVIPVPHTPKSLVWDDGCLVDWVAGGTRFHLDGRVEDPGVRYAYCFDAAAATSTGNFSAVYTKLGTKGLILERGTVLREINRSYYQANLYEYPIALFSLPDGREVIAHCPDEYNQIEIDLLRTGERLTQSNTRKPKDVFHSRLNASADGKHLVSAGWSWHPVDVVEVFDVLKALAEPSHLDGRGVLESIWTECGISAAFFGNGHVAVGYEPVTHDDVSNQAPCATPQMQMYDLSSPGAPRACSLDASAGAMMAIDDQYFLSLQVFPKLVDLRAGRVVEAWPHLACGTNTSSIRTSEVPSPAYAFENSGLRCAIASDSAIHVLEFQR